MDSRCTTFRVRSSEFKPEYPKDALHLYYKDQTTSNTIFLDRNIFCAYTPYGIRQMDSWYGEQIRNLEKSNYTANQLEGFIIANPHLHNVIKTNLLENLKTYAKLLSTSD